MKLSPQEARTLLQVSPVTWGFLMSRPEFPKPETDGRRKLYDQCDLLTWLASRSTERDIEPIVQRLIAAGWLKVIVRHD